MKNIQGTLDLSITLTDEDRAKLPSDYVLTQHIQEILAAALDKYLYDDKGVSYLEVHGLLADRFETTHEDEDF